MSSFYPLPYYLIENNKVVNELLYNLFSQEISSRYAINKFTSSCKFTQLRYIILYIYEKRVNKSILEIFVNRVNKNKEYSVMLNDISSIVQKFMSQKTTPLYNVIVTNQIYPDFISKWVIPIENNNQLSNYLTANSLQPMPYLNICFCIYNFFDSMYYIIHYFTLIIQKNNNSFTYYINSAYGSDNVCIPQYTTDISFDELNLFFNVFNNIGNNQDSFYYLFSKYFGKGGLSQNYSQEQIEENKKLQFSSIEPSVGLEQEISMFSVNSKVGIIHNYQEYISSFTNPLPFNGGKKPKHKKHNRKSKKNKSKCKLKKNKSKTNKTKCK
jgi:hypothetical protein